jgi:A/G-specific adenine glycosylase
MTEAMTEDPTARALARALLAWFDRHRRDLPWRRTRDPYRIWVSEVMLQQTRVEAALAYYERFVARFPTVDELARAPLEEVLALWSGLGYYRRARQLHAAARLIAEAGEFPRTTDRLLELPGVGAYTAAAVASIAFGVAVPVLDGNVERVMARRLALADDPKRGAARARLLAAAAALLDPSRPGDSNQALMELGATLCLPQRPHCLLCPLLSGCAAARQGCPELYPRPRRRRRSESRLLLVALVTLPEEPDRVLLFRRSPQEGLLAGTWELPWLEDGGEEGSPQLPAGLAEKYGGEWRLGPPIAAVRHGITYRDLRVAVCRAERRPGAADEVREGVASGWFDAAERSRLPMSSLVGKVLRACATEARTNPITGAKGS